MSTTVDYPVFMPERVRDAEATTTAILDAARAQFGVTGFERTTIRSVANAAGVDPALVMRYFGNKAGLFAAATRLEFRFPDLTGVAPDRVADAVLPVFAQIWGTQGPLLPLLRASATSREAADALLAVFVDRVTPAIAQVVPDQPAQRAALLGSQLLGIAVARHIVGLPAIEQMHDEALIGWLRPVFARYLFDDAPA